MTIREWQAMMLLETGEKYSIAQAKVMMSVEGEHEAEAIAGGKYDVAPEPEYRVHVPYGRCPAHPHIAISNGQFDGLCNLCEGEMDAQLAAELMAEEGGDGVTTETEEGFACDGWNWKRAPSPTMNPEQESIAREWFPTAYDDVPF